MSRFRQVIALVASVTFLMGCGSQPAPPGPVAPTEPVATKTAEEPKSVPAPTKPEATPQNHAATATATKPTQRNLKVLPGPVTAELMGLPFPPNATMIDTESAAVEMNGTRTVRAVFTTATPPAQIVNFYTSRAKVTSKEEIEIEGSPVTHIRGSKGDLAFDISATVPQGSDQTRVKIETTRSAR